ncbi:MAG TPA: hypothetical protein VEF04_03015, partial [Blastocatellia bacterium]|nr:hypothetical protein [Blastocatellia bacterium]
MDWNQEQRITTRVNGKEVTHCLIPISDPHFLDYMDQRENLEQDEALVLFYNTFVDRLEGVKDLPEDWRMYLPASEKRDV